MIGEPALIPPPIATVVGASFDALVLNGRGPIVVEFMSYGCAHCRALEPALRQVAEALVPRERVMRVNVAVEPELADAYGVRVTPTLVMFLDGCEVGRAERPLPRAANIMALVTRPFAERN